jgi:hypothetical protein
MKRMNILIIAVLVTLFTVAGASALNPSQGTVDITSTAPKDPATGAFILTTGQDANTLYNLQAEYNNFPVPVDFGVQVREGQYDWSGAVVYNIPVSSSLAPSFTVPIHWIPTPAQHGQIFTIYASGVALGTYKLAAQLAQPTPELSSGALVSVGLIGLLGMIRYRRKE